VDTILNLQWRHSPLECATENPSMNVGVTSYFQHGTQRGVQSMGPIFIPRDLNFEHRGILWKPLPQKNDIMSPEISPKTESDAGTTVD
jgi:hypothetical protein